MRRNPILIQFLFVKFSFNASVSFHNMMQ